MKLFKILSFLLLANSLLYNCQKKEIFKPVEKSKSDYSKESQEYSRKREEKERNYIQNWIDKQQDSLSITYTPTASGFWIRFIEKKGLEKPLKNTMVSYSAEIQTLSGATIYTPEEFGKREGFLGKFKEIRGIESALYLMGKDDTAELIIPSFSAYGLYGDENKIGANVPLRIILHLDEVK